MWELLSFEYVIKTSVDKENNFRKTKSMQHGLVVLQKEQSSSYSILIFVISLLGWPCLASPGPLSIHPTFCMPLHPIHRPGQLEICEPHAALCPVSCDSYVNTVFVYALVVKFCTSCSPWKSGWGLHTRCDLHMHCVEACLVACASTYTRAHLCNTYVSYRVARKCVL